MKKNYSLIILGLTIISIIINIVLFNSIPDKIAMQINASGNLNNFIPKTIFVFITPVALFIDYIYMINSSEKPSKPIVVGIILFSLNMLMLIVNM